MFGGETGYKKLAQKCVDMDKACHTYLSIKGKIFVMNCYKFHVLFIGYINLVTHFLCAGTSKLTEAKNNNTRRNNFFNHVDTFFYINKTFRKNIL